MANQVDSEDRDGEYGIGVLGGIVTGVVENIGNGIKSVFERLARKVKWCYDCLRTIDGVLTCILITVLLFVLWSPTNQIPAWPSGIAGLVTLVVFFLYWKKR